MKQNQKLLWIDTVNKDLTQRGLH